MKRYCATSPPSSTAPGGSVGSTRARARVAPLLMAVLVCASGSALKADDGTEPPCGVPVPTVEGPAFNPENVCASFPPAQTGPITDPDVQRPDESAWRIFSEINFPVPGRSDYPTWRTWPEQAEVYPPTRIPRILPSGMTSPAPSPSSAVGPRCNNDSRVPMAASTPPWPTPTMRAAR